MALFVQRIHESYDYLFNELSNPNVGKYYLMGSPLPIIILLSAYYYFVYYGGVSMMKNRKPYKLENILLVNNAFQILANAYLAIEISQIVLKFKGDYFCMYIEDQNSSMAHEFKYVSYLYFLLKVTDLMDTIFMVLKKNYHQVSFLHVYHHMGMVVGTWAMTKFSRGCQEGVIGLFNVYVHVFMYSYYFISAKYPQIKQYLWLKKMVTQIQLLQFVIVFIHNFIPFVNPSCIITKWTLLPSLSQSVFMIYLFSTFYYESYIKPLQKKKHEIKNKKQ